MITPDTTRQTFADRRWALTAGVAGVLALLSYGALIATNTTGPLAVGLAFGFAFGVTIASIGLHLGITTLVAPRIGLLAAVANTMAATLLLAMILVQLAVKSAVPRPDEAFTAIWLGLDVAWDLFGGTAVVLFGIALAHHARFWPLTAMAGVAVGVLMLMLNIATFPEPPAEAGWFDAGPLVGLWYLVVCGRLLWLTGREREQPGIIQGLPL